jgi:hypothetical protein
MTVVHRARLRALALGAVLLAATLVIAGPAPAGAKTDRITKKDACKVLTKSQLEKVFGADATSQGQVKTNKGLDVLCDWAIAAAGDRPAGTVRVAVSFAVPPGAYKALKNNAQFEVIEGLGADALYSKATNTLTLFKGNRIVRIRGLFNDTTVRPIRTYDPKLLLLVLGKTALPRL